MRSISVFGAGLTAPKPGSSPSESNISDRNTDDEVFCLPPITPVDAERCNPAVALCTSLAFVRFIS
jgi:hypothetical protein